MKVYLVSVIINEIMPYTKLLILLSEKANIQHNKLMKLDNSMLMYGIYNAETLEKLIKTVHKFIPQHLPMKDCLQGNIAPPHLEYFMHTP